MATDNPKISVYVPLEISAKLETLKTNGQIKSLSNGIVEILKIYFGMPSLLGQPAVETINGNQQLTVMEDRLANLESITKNTEADRKNIALTMESLYHINNRIKKLEESIETQTKKDKTVLEKKSNEEPLSAIQISMFDPVEDNSKNNTEIEEIKVNTEEEKDENLELPEEDENFKTIRETLEILRKEDPRGRWTDSKLRRSIKKSAFLVKGYSIEYGRKIGDRGRNSKVLLKVKKLD
jgi:hypothetical protein